MRTLIKYAGLLLVSLLPAIVLLLAGFRIASAVRETATAGEAPRDGSRLIQVEGLAIHYRQWGPEDGPPVVLIHGTMAWAETWRDIAGPLGERGFRVLAPDMPPFGYSQRPADGSYSRERQAALITGFADALGLRNYVLAGHSFSGGATVEAALQAAPAVRALVLIDVALQLSGPQSPNRLVSTLLQAAPLRSAIASATFANPLVIPYGLRAFVRDAAVVTSERVALYGAPLEVAGTASALGDWLRSGLMGSHAGARSSRPENLAALRLPALIIWGRDDTVTPLSQGEEIAALLPDARLVVLDEVNHIPHIERPEAVLQALDGFLAEIASR